MFLPILAIEVLGPALQRKPNPLCSTVLTDHPLPPPLTSARPAAVDRFAWPKSLIESARAEGGGGQGMTMRL